MKPGSRVSPSEKSLAAVCGGETATPSERLVVASSKKKIAGDWAGETSFTLGKVARPDRSAGNLAWMAQQAPVAI